MSGLTNAAMVMFIHTAQTYVPSGMHTRKTRQTPALARADSAFLQVSEYERLPQKFNTIRGLRCTPVELECSLDQTAEEARETQIALWAMIDRDPSFFVSGLKTSEPSFTRLFTHDTWADYTGRRPLTRWLIVTKTWRFSTILRAVFPIAFVASLWAYVISSLPAALLPRTSPVPMSLMGTALGLLLVFRTNNSYLRLMEARILWSSVLDTIRGIGQTVATALLWDKNVGHKTDARDGAARVALYLAGFAWELRARLMGGTIAHDSDVINVIYDDSEEATFVANQRIRPLHLLSDMRRELHDQYTEGNLPDHIHRQLAEDMRELDRIVGSCERLFSSPLPPTMSRHVVRCLQLWLLGFPFVLAGTMAPITTSIWVFATAYAFVGIDEVGVQVEQPFDILPMNSNAPAHRNEAVTQAQKFPPFALYSLLNPGD